MEIVGKKGGGGGEKKEKPAAKAPSVEAPAKPSGPPKKAPPAKVSLFILSFCCLILNELKDLKQIFVSRTGCRTSQEGQTCLCPKCEVQERSRC